MINIFNTVVVIKCKEAVITSISFKLKFGSSLRFTAGIISIYRVLFHDQPAKCYKEEPRTTLRINGDKWFDTQTKVSSMSIEQRIYIY